MVKSKSCKQILKILLNLKFYIKMGLMKKKLLLLLSLLLVSAQVNAFELILPREKKGIVNTKYAFFVGKAGLSENVTINKEHIYKASNGAFAHTVKLKDGENKIIVRSNYGTQIFKLYKNFPQTNQEVRTETFEPKTAVVTGQNVPLRSTPVDGGLNRMGHLFFCTSLLVNGSKGDFYRVYLSKDKTGWVAKKDVKITDLDFEPAEFLGMNNEQFKNAVVQSITMSKILPYTIEDGEKEIIFNVYNPELSDESVYHINIPKPKKYTYSVDSDNGKYTVKVKTLPKELKECTVVIDAGHGGLESGAIGCLGDKEKNVNLRIAQELQRILVSKGVNVIMTRECDCDLDLKDRVEIAKSNDADIFVSIHLNSIGDVPMDIHKTRGTSVYYFNQNSKRLAEKLEKSVTKSAGTREDGVYTGSYAVIRPTNYVGVLVEVAYMTSPLDTLIYKSDEFPEEAAKGIANGIESFVKHK